MPYAATREYAHELIDRIAPSQVPTVVGLLETMLDPVSRAVASAPYEDEVLTDGAKQALAERNRRLRKRLTGRNKMTLFRMRSCLRSWGSVRKK